MIREAAAPRIMGGKGFTVFLWGGARGSSRVMTPAGRRGRAAYFVDSNIWLYFFLRDNEKKYKLAEDFS